MIGGRLVLLRRALRAAWLLLALVPSVPVAVVQAADSTSCHIGARLIRAVRRPSGATGPVRVSRDLPMTSFLADVHDQLAPLPFTDYDTIDMAEQVVKLRHSAALRLSGPSKEEHLVTVLPHEVARGRVYTTVEWKDPHGEGLVSTKMRIVNGENVVLGADGNSDGPEDSSMIVSVRLSCE